MPPLAPELPAHVLAETSGMERSMRRPRFQQNAIRNQKRIVDPGVRLRTFDVDHRRQPEQLLHRMENKDLLVRQVAAVALARMSERHPARLVRIIERLIEVLKDDSAYVRWHLVYVLGKVMSFSFARTSAFLGDLVSRLEDDNRIVRLLACKALRQLATQYPAAVERVFGELKKGFPPRW
jgi:hypothetical protein